MDKAKRGPGRGAGNPMAAMMGGDKDPSQMIKGALDSLSKNDPTTGAMIKGVTDIIGNPQMQDVAKNVLKGPLSGLNKI